MSEVESKRAIEQVLRTFAAQPLKAAATGLFNALGYASKKTLDLKPNDFAGFCAMFDPDGITREINKLLQIPAMLLFRHGESLTLAVIDRRLSKRDESKDVLKKVTLIKGTRRNQGCGRMRLLRTESHG